MKAFGSLKYFRSAGTRLLINNREFESFVSKNILLISI